MASEAQQMEEYYLGTMAPDQIDEFLEKRIASTKTHKSIAYESTERVRRWMNWPKVSTEGIAALEAKLALLYILYFLILVGGLCFLSFVYSSFAANIYSHRFVKVSPFVILLLFMGNYYRSMIGRGSVVHPQFFRIFRIMFLLVLLFVLPLAALCWRLISQFTAVEFTTIAGPAVVVAVGCLASPMRHAYKSISLKEQHQGYLFVIFISETFRHLPVTAILFAIWSSLTGIHIDVALVLGLIAVMCLQVDEIALHDAVKNKVFSSFFVPTAALEGILKGVSVSALGWYLSYPFSVLNCVIGIIIIGGVNGLAAAHIRKSLLVKLNKYFEEGHSPLRLIMIDVTICLTIMYCLMRFHLLPSYPGSNFAGPLVPFIASIGVSRVTPGLSGLFYGRLSSRSVAGKYLFVFLRRMLGLKVEKVA